MRFLRAVVDVARDPDAFFEREPSFAGAVAVAALAGLAVVASVFLIVEWFAGAIAPEVVSTLQGLLLVAVLIGVPLGWLLTAGIAHVVSALFDGSGSFGRTFTYVGWGFAPDLLVGPIQFVLVYRFTSTTAPPTTLARAAAYEEALYQDPLMQLSGVLGLLAALWSGYIWVYALKHARDLSLRHAAISVAVPVLWFLYDSATSTTAG